ncbi:hypothetical protein BS78_07G146400 [Paspalum vaginatum]|nr:hypothetical protein BS78_07G146400 [Paspalum vaginatum]
MHETKTHALSIHSMPVGEQELRDEICNYIMSIGHDQALGKEWVLSSKPYPIALSAKKIQGILRKDQAMDVCCFNLAVRSLAFEEIQSLKRWNKIVSKHYRDLKFSAACQFGEGPKYRTKIDYKQLAKLVLAWPWISFDVSKCTLVMFLTFSTITP